MNVFIKKKSESATILRSSSMLPMLLFCIIIIAMSLIALMLSSSAIAADDIEILNSTIQLSGNPGATVSGAFDVENRGDTSGFVTFSGYTLTHTTSSSRTLTLNSINAVNTNNGSNTTVSFSAPIPSSQYAGVYRGNLTATLGADTSQMTVEINVNASPASVSLQSPSALSVVAGTSATTASNLANSGNVDISSVVVTVTDLTSGSNTIPSAYVNLNPSSTSLNYSVTVPITITISVPATQASGTYTGTLSAVFGSTQVNATLTVVVSGQSPAITVGSTSATWAKGVTTSISKTINVQNTGNFNLTAVTMNVEQVCGATINPDQSSFNLATGASQAVVLTITGISSAQSAATCYGYINATSGSTVGSGTLTLVVRDPTYSVSVPSTMSIGSGNVARNSTQTGTFTVTNDGDYSVTVNLTSTASSKYSVSFSESVFTLGPGASKTITVTAYVPADQSSGTQSIGMVNVKYGSDSTPVKTVTMQVSTESKLRVYKVAARVAGASDSTVSNGATIDDEARPGDSFVVDVTMQNNYGSGTDVDIDDISITVTVYDLDDGSDVDKDSSEFKLRPTKKATKSFSFSVPEDTEENSYKIGIEASGVDSEGSTHTASWTVYLDVDKKEHDLKIKRFEFSNNVLSCNERTATLYVRVENRGSNYEEDAAVSINQTQLLGVSLYEQFELDNDLGSDDSEFSKTYTINLPGNTAPGDYVFTLWAYYDEDIPFDYKQATLTLKSCDQSAGSSGAGSVSGGGTAGTTGASGGGISGTSGTSGSTTGSTTGSISPAAGPDQSAVVILPSSSTSPAEASSVSSVSFSRSVLYIALLAIGVLFLIGLLVAMIFSMRKQ